MAIRWKVVDNKRRSCVVKPTSKYSLIYKKGFIVKANNITIGIMVFKRKKDAKDFMSGHCATFHNGKKLIKVRTFEKGKKPKYTCRAILVDEAYESFLLNSEIIEYYFFTKSYLPKGTLCYSKVEVLT